MLICKQAQKHKNKLYKSVKAYVVMAEALQTQLAPGNPEQMLPQQVQPMGEQAGEGVVLPSENYRQALYEKALDDAAALNGLTARDVESALSAGKYDSTLAGILDRADAATQQYDLEVDAEIESTRKRTAALTDEYGYTHPTLTPAEELHAKAYADAIVGYGLTAEDVADPNNDKVAPFVNAAHKVADGVVATHHAAVEREILDRRIAEGARIADFKWGNNEPVTMAELEKSAARVTAPVAQIEASAPAVETVAQPTTQHDETVAAARNRHLHAVPDTTQQLPVVTVATEVPAAAEQGPYEFGSTFPAFAAAGEGSEIQYLKGTAPGRFGSGAHYARLIQNAQSRHEVPEVGAGDSLADAAATAPPLVRPEELVYSHDGTIPMPASGAEHADDRRHEGQDADNDAARPTTLIRHETVAADDDPTVVMSTVTEAQPTSLPDDSDDLSRDLINFLDNYDAKQASDASGDDPTELLGVPPAPALSAEAPAPRRGRIRTALSAVRHPVKTGKAAVKGIGPWRQGIRDRRLKTLPEGGEYMPGYDPNDDPNLELVGHPDEEHFADRGAYELPRGGLSKRQYRKTMEAYYNGELDEKPADSERVRAVGRGDITFDDPGELKGARIVNANGPEVTPRRDQREAAAAVVTRQEIFNRINNNITFLQGVSAEVQRDLPRQAGEDDDAYVNRIDPTYQQRLRDIYFAETNFAGVADPLEVRRRGRKATSRHRAAA
jgi:hypothetical protein